MPIVPYSKTNMASSCKIEMDFHAFINESHVSVETDGSDYVQKDGGLTFFKLKVSCHL